MKNNKFLYIILALLLVTGAFLGVRYFIEEGRETEEEIEYAEEVPGEEGEEEIDEVEGENGDDELVSRRADRQIISGELSSIGDIDGGFNYTLLIRMADNFLEYDEDRGDIREVELIVSEEIEPIEGGDPELTEERPIELDDIEVGDNLIVSLNVPAIELYNYDQFTARGVKRYIEDYDNDEENEEADEDLDY